VTVSGIRPCSGTGLARWWRSRRAFPQDCTEVKLSVDSLHYAHAVPADGATLSSVGAAGRNRHRAGDPAGPVRLLRILVVLAVVAATVYPRQRALRKPTAKNGADYRGAVRLLQRYGLPGDAILCGVICTNRASSPTTKSASSRQPRLW
jgi:hypothetical protein